MSMQNTVVRKCHAISCKYNEKGRCTLKFTKINIDDTCSFLYSKLTRDDFDNEYLIEAFVVWKLYFHFLMKKYLTKLPKEGCI